MTVVYIVGLVVAGIIVSILLFDFVYRPLMVRRYGKRKP